MKSLKNVVLNVLFVVFAICMIGCGVTAPVYRIADYKRNVVNQSIKQGGKNNHSLNTNVRGQNSAIRELAFLAVSNDKFVGKMKIVDNGGILDTILLYQVYVVNQYYETVAWRLEDYYGVNIDHGLIMGLKDKREELDKERLKARYKKIPVKKSTFDTVVTIDTIQIGDTTQVVTSVRIEEKVTYSEKRDMSWRGMSREVSFVMDTIWVPYSNKYKVIYSAEGYSEQEGHFSVNLRPGKTFGCPGHNFFRFRNR